MTRNLLILYTRVGCCLCEGLEQRLKAISLKEINPSLNLRVIDIDSDEATERERVNYDLIVPVMLVVLEQKNRFFELPRVSPRIKEKELLFWLQKRINKIFDS